MSDDKAPCSARRLHDRIGAMIDQVGQPDYSLRELVDGLREVRDDLMRLETRSSSAACVCGNPTVLGVVHRAEAPCFHYQEPVSASAATELRRKIEGFRALKANWDSYGAEPFPELTIQRALKVADLLGDEWKVIPCADGPSVWFYLGDEDEVIEVRSSATADRRGQNG